MPRHDARTHRAGRQGADLRDLAVLAQIPAVGLKREGDIIWAKPNPMPESVRDRCTKSHEYLFLLAKRERYYYDAEAIAEESVYGGEELGIMRGNKVRAESMARFTRNSYPNEARAKACVQGPSARDRGDGSLKMDETRNKRSVWTVTTQPYSEAHFATFPPELIKPCILAGSRPGDVVFDPFIGSGTTAQVALELGRQYLGCELNPEYARLCDDRTKVTVGLPLAPRQTQGLRSEDGGLSQTRNPQSHIPNPA